MKIWKALIAILVFIVLILLCFGIFKKSVSYGHEIIADKGIEDAWRITQDDSKFHEWLEGFQSIELISGELGKVGSKYKVVVLPSEDEAPFEMIQTVRSIKEFEHVAMDYTSEMMDFEQTIYFKDKNGKTVIGTDSKVMGKNLFTRSMFAIMETFFGSFTKQERKNIEALKVVIEND